MKKKYSRPTQKMVRLTPTHLLQYSVKSFKAVEESNYGSTED